jgi:sodium/hydrogen exchanger 3
LDYSKSALKYPISFWTGFNLVQINQGVKIRNLNTDPATGNLMGREEIQEFGDKMARETQSDYCLHGGKMQIVYKDVSFRHSSKNQYDQKYLWTCPYNYIGRRCEECAKGYFGPHCHPCPKHQINNLVCGAGGIWDDGINGKGRWFCKNPEYDANNFCETKINEDNHQNEEVIAFGFFLLVVVGFFVTILLYTYNKIHSLEVFPESIASIILGIIVGLFFKSHYKNTGLLNILEFEPHTFFLFLLPPIMFQAGFSMRASTFFRNILVINSFAIFATIIASFIFSFIFAYGTSLTSNEFSYLDSLHFGCFISAIDPVATIAIFKSLSVNDKIYMIVFGESTLNDAVAIAAAQSVERISDMAAAGGELVLGDTLLFALEKFMIYFFVSILIGAVWSFLISYLYTVLELNTVPWIEIGFFILTSYFPYILSEALGCSGILSILIWGILMRNYAFYSLSPFGNVTIEYLTEWLGLMSENFIFAYVGISVPLMINDVNIYYVLVGIVALVTSRFLSVLIVAVWVNPFKKDKIRFSHLLVMTIGGLRGAVAFYLALNVSSEYKHLIITTTISLILFTVIGMGSATPIFIKYLNKKFPEDEIIVKPSEDEMPLRGEDGGFGDGGERYNPRNSIGVFSQAEDIDKNYFQKLFRKDGWEYYRATEGRKNLQNDVQVSYQEVERDMTKARGDFSPNRISKVAKEEYQKRIQDSSQEKGKTKRALTPPNYKRDDIEQDLRGILKDKSPRKESGLFMLHFRRWIWRQC